MTYRSRQEIFDIAYLGLKGQGFEYSASKDDEKQCLYRGPNGLKCAIGYLIADEEYSEDFEGISPENSIDVCLAAKIKIEDRHWAGKLQECHDFSQSPKDMQQRLIAFAQEYGLNVPE